MSAIIKTPLLIMILVAWLYPHAAQAQQVLDQMRAVGNLAIDGATVLGTIGAILGLIKSGQAFNEGNADEGWQRLKSTMIGLGLILCAAAIVQLVSSKLGGNFWR